MDLGPGDGELRVRTGVTGTAARMGHALELAIDRWRADVHLDGRTVTAVTVTAELDSLRVVAGTGGVKPLTQADRRTIRQNALRTMDTAHHPTATFTSGSVTSTDVRLSVTGTLTIAGRTQELATRVDLAPDGDGVRAHCQVVVRQSSFGISPYSAMLGQLRVADEVAVSLEIRAASSVIPPSR